MQNSKLIASLRQMTDGELQRFRQFVASPYFNKRSELLTLLDYLIRFWPDFDADKLTKAAAYRAVHGDKAYKDKQLRYLMSWLTQLVEQFWLIERQSADEARNTVQLMDILSERGLHKAYRKYDRQLQGRFEEAVGHDGAYFYSRQQWAEARERHFQRQRQRRYDPALQETVDYLDRYYYLERLKLACAMLDRQAILQSDYEIGLDEEWFAQLQKQAFFGEPLIELYYFIFLALQEEAEDRYFEQLRSKLDEVSGRIQRDRLREVYHVLINYCARKIRQGKSKYVGEALQLYTVGIEREILIERGELSPWAFTNVVKLALRLQRYEWIEDFIKRYSALLPADFRENALHYNLAELYYYTHRLDQAQFHLNQVAYTDLNYYLGARTMLAKIYYEQQEEEPLLSLLAAFTIFLKRNKELSSPIKQTFLHFCELLYQLIRRPEKKLPELRDKIESTSPLTDRDWLLARLQERL